MILLRSHGQQTRTTWVTTFLNLNDVSYRIGNVDSVVTEPRALLCPARPRRYCLDVDSNDIQQSWGGSRQRQLHLDCAICRTFRVSISNENSMLLKLTKCYFSSYALWLSGQNIPNNGSGYANLTNWFKVEGGPEDADSRHALSTGQLARVVVGIVIAVSLVSTTILVLWRRVLRKALRVSIVEAHQRESFDSIIDKKTETKLTIRQVDI